MTSTRCRGCGDDKNARNMNTVRPEGLAHEKKWHRTGGTELCPTCLDHFTDPMPTDVVGWGAFRTLAGILNIDLVQDIESGQIFVPAFDRGIRTLPARKAQDAAAPIGRN